MITTPPPDWRSVREKLAKAQAADGPKARRAALVDVVDEVIRVFEGCEPTAWEAHFLLHAIQHIKGGYPAVATEEILSVLKPRDQQCDIDAGDLPPAGFRMPVRPGLSPMA